jgi:hypothetical protein
MTGRRQPSGVAQLATWARTSPSASRTDKWRSRRLFSKQFQRGTRYTCVRRALIRKNARLWSKRITPARIFLDSLRPPTRLDDPHVLVFSRERYGPEPEGRLGQPSRFAGLVGTHISFVID